MAGTQATIFLFIFVFSSALGALSRPRDHDLDVLRKERVTRLRFYLHDTISGGLNATAVEVARPSGRHGTANGPTPFGSVFVVDDVMTDGPELNNSSVVGSAQGIYASTDLRGLSLVLGMDFQFTSGSFNGSSFVVYSRNPILKANREVAVVGGRGKFRMARGFARLRTYYLNTKNGDAVIEYNVTLLHYDW